MGQPPSMATAAPKTVALKPIRHTRFAPPFVD